MNINQKKLKDKYESELLDLKIKYLALGLNSIRLTERRKEEHDKEK